MSPSPQPRERSLAVTVTEIEQHAARRGWDAPVAVFALISTARAIEVNPALADELPSELVAAARDDAEHLTSIEQDGLPDLDSLEDVLARMAWPDTVDGVAIVVERVIVPPAVEEAMPADPTKALAYLANHPARQDVRIAAGALRTGESWCAIRTRANDSDDAVGGAPDAVPGLIEALRATLS